MKRILIIYATLSGNTEIVCTKVLSVLEKKGFKVDMKKVEKTNVSEMFNYDLNILASPTYGHGVLEEYFITFYEKMIQTDLKKKPCAIIGLGDFKYDNDYHLESIKILEEGVKLANGEIFFEPLRITKSPLRTINNLIPKWAENLSEKIKSL